MAALLWLSKKLHLMEPKATFTRQYERHGSFLTVRSRHVAVGGRRLERLFASHPRYQNRLCALRRRPALEPATPAVPTATEKNQHNDEDYKKCRRVHAVLLARLPT
jgi:hypothetical protein